jgi:hypothetical protein
LTVTHTSGTASTVDVIEVPGVVETVEESAGAFVFDASGWWTTTDNKYSGGSARTTGTAGKKVTVTFDGTGVSLIGSRGPDRAIAEISIDGMSYGTVKTYAPAPYNRYVLFSEFGLAPGTHTLTITHTGTGNTSPSYLTIDAIHHRS